jgi:hypothetical protein
MDLTRLGCTLLVAQLLLAWPGTGAAGQSGEDGEDETPTDGVVGSFGLGPGSRGVGGQISIWAQLGEHSLGFRTTSTFISTRSPPSQGSRSISCSATSAPERARSRRDAHEWWHLGPRRDPPFGGQGPPHRVVGDDPPPEPALPVT